MIWQVVNHPSGGNGGYARARHFDLMQLPKAIVDKRAADKEEAQAEVEQVLEREKHRLALAMGGSPSSSPSKKRRT